MAAPPLTLLLLAALVYHASAVEYGWKSNKEYTFGVQGQSLAGLPSLKPQYAGFHFRGEVRVQAHAPRVLLLKMFNMTYTRIHEELPQGWWKGPMEMSSQNKTKPLPITTSTVLVKLTASTSPELVLQADLDDWQVNFIKGLVHKLLAFLGDTTSTQLNSHTSASSDQSPVFTVIEDSVVGQCEVMYEVSELAQRLAPPRSDKLCPPQSQLWQITKTPDYNKCRLLSEDHAHLPTRDCTPGGANCGSFWSRAALTLMIGCGEKNNFILLSSVTTSLIRAQLHLHNSSQAVVNSNLNVTLISVMELKKRFNPPQNRQSHKTLLYSYTAPTRDLYSRPCQDGGDNSNEEVVHPTDVQGEKHIPSGTYNSTDIDESTRSESKYYRMRVKRESNRKMKYALQKKMMEKYGLDNDNENSNNNIHQRKPKRRLPTIQQQNSRAGSEERFSNVATFQQASGEQSGGGGCTEEFANKGGNNGPSSKQDSRENPFNNGPSSKQDSRENPFNNGPSSQQHSREKPFNNGPSSKQHSREEGVNNGPKSPKESGEKGVNNEPTSQPRSGEKPFNNGPTSEHGSGERRLKNRPKYRPGNKNPWNIDKNSPINPTSAESVGVEDGFQPTNVHEDDDQPSEEMELENYWNISSKGMKTAPPHQPFNIFTLGHRSMYEMSCLSPKLRQTIADITGDMAEHNILPEKITLEKLGLAVDICRSLPLDQLTSVSEEVFEVHNGPNINSLKLSERKVFRDIVTMCGTHSALQLIKGWVERRQVEGEEAAEMIASFPTHVISPTSYLIKDFFEMVQLITERDDDQLSTTAVLAFSNLVRAACVNQKLRQHYFGSIVKPVCNTNFVGNYTKWLTRQVKSETNLRRVYVEGLGNVGSPDVVGALVKIAQNPNYSTYLQSSAVLALRYQVLRKNPQVVPMLLSLYNNYSLPAATRIAAVTLLVYSEPGMATWQRLAISTWYEPNPAVTHFVTSTLQNMAASKDSVYSDAMQAAKLVLPLAKPVKVSSYQPYNLFSSSLSSDFEQIVLEQLSWMQFYNFNSFYYRHSSRLSGFMRTNLETSFTATNVNQLWSSLKRLFTETNENEKVNNPAKGFNQKWMQLQQALGLHSRSLPQLEADLHLRINNMVERMFTVNKDTIKSWTKGGRKLVQQFLKEGTIMSYQKMDMSGFHISTTTELGFPVQFSLRTPWVLNAKADMNITEDGLAFGGSFMYSSQLLSSVSVLSAWDNTVHSAGAHATNFIQLPPLRVLATLDSASDSLALKTSYVDQHRLLYLAMQPFTSQRKVKILLPSLLSPDTIKVKLGQSYQMPIAVLSHYVNTVYSSEEREHFSPTDFMRQARIVFGFPTMMPNMEARSIETIMNPLHPLVMKFSMSTASKINGQLEVYSSSDTVMKGVYNAFTKIILQDRDNGVDGKHSKEEVATNSEQQSSNEDQQDISLANEAAPTNHTNNYRQAPKDGQQETFKASVNTEPFVTTTPSTSQDVDAEKHPEEGSESSANPKRVTYDVYPITYDSAVGSFNASDIDPFSNTVNGSNHYYIIEQILSKIISGNAVVFGLNVQSSAVDKPLKASFYAAYANILSRRLDRLGFFMSVGSAETRMTVIHEDPVDMATDLRRRVADDLYHRINVDFVHKFENYDFEAFIKTTLGMSRSRLAELKNSYLVETCSQLGYKRYDSALNQECQQLNAQTKQIGYGIVKLHYNDNAKVLENIARKAMNAAKLMLPGTVEKPGEGDNTLSLSFDVDYRTGSVDSFISTPITSVDIHRFPLARMPMSSVFEWAMHHTAAPEYCGISARRIRTFDGAEFKYDMKNNWHVAAFDCTGQHHFALFAQAGSTNNNSVLVELNVDESVISIEEGPTVYVDGKGQLLNVSEPLLIHMDSEGQMLAHTVFTPDYSLHIHLPRDKLDIIYSNTSLIIRAEQGLQGRLCGLCGSYAKSGVEEFLTADGSGARSPKEFATSYILKNDATKNIAFLP